MKTLKIIFLSILVAMLAACATMPASQSAYNQKMSWQARSNQLKKIKQWTIQGAVAIQRSNQAESAYLTWQQHNNNYTLHLFGPLGMGAVNITGQPGQFTLKNAQGQILQAKSPESLIQQEMGWTLPVSNLYYWVRGLPVPNLKATKQFDEYHHLIKLNQEGWQINYLQYTGIKGIDLPSKLTLKNPKLSLRLVINQWRRDS
mgnify:CR=1 FL=1